MNIVRSSWLKLALAAVVFASGAAHAQYPERPIRILNGFAAGGAFDLVARIIAQKITEKDPRWNFIVENKPGADGRIATGECAKAAPDGYTICIGASSSNAIHAGVFRQLPYDLVNDFLPLFFVGGSANVIVAQANAPFNTVAELVKYAKANPKSISYASSGNGTSAHIGGELFNQMADVGFLHVPYKGGAPAVTAAIGGQTTILVSTMSNVEAHINQGKLKALAVTSLQRDPVLPNVPTVAETIPGYSIGNWYAFFAPAKLPPAIANELYSRMKAAAELPEVKSFLEKRGIMTTIMTQAEFRNFHKAEIDKYKAVANKANIDLQ
ncbi:Bug family tripartite tricarboxylate transporter substrate binding protein [Ramlibacter sp.]|uniref:Bug family tripartite tricarboxylate transporter substrate binding protein n=1 Tax=Ramlibacter sp. TaxID=1917967 RepID=UPI003D14EA7C